MVEFDKEATVGRPIPLTKYGIRLNLVYDVAMGSDAQQVLLIIQDILSKIPAVEGAGISTVETSFWNREGGSDW